jgi:hypothetical protein
LISGKALLGEVGHYLRRAGLASATDMLTAISALGWIPEGELGKLGAELQIPRADAARLLTMAARSGLIDVLTGPLDGSRSYVVRSAMLADARVADQAFSAPVPGLGILGLVGQWPGHAAELTGAVITAAVLGAVNARHLARELLDEAIGDTEIPQQIKKSLCLEFMRLDRSAAEHATRIARQTLGQLDSADATAPLT